MSFLIIEGNTGIPVMVEVHEKENVIKFFADLLDDQTLLQRFINNDERYTTVFFNRDGWSTRYWIIVKLS